MHLRPQAAVAIALCASLVAPLPGGLTPSEARAVSPLTRTIIAAASPPVRVQVKEPARVRPSIPPASAMRPPKTVPGVRRASGLRVSGPPMLRPTEIDAVLKAAASARKRVPAATSTAPIGGGVRRVGVPSVPGVRPGIRHTQSLPSDPNASGTGINPWWRYQEQSVPGGGRLMVNVGTGNLLLQDDDMSVPHKGIAMAFRRTYNSQSRHDVNASDAAEFVYKPPGIYGNGWTNTFDAYLARTATGQTGATFSVFDIDGTRYDYFNPVGSTSVWLPAPGNHNTLTFDGTCGFLWTKKSGTTYYFYRPNPSTTCPSFPSNGGSAGGYAGRLYQIIGRNRNTYLSFNYSWDGGNASSTGKISAISVQSESGLTATLSFADFNGHRLLQQLTFPDQATSVTYGYDANGNLSSVSRPPNNSSGIRPLQTYDYQQRGPDFVIHDIASPRFNAACMAGSCGSDGGALVVGIAGSGAPTSAVTDIGHVAVVNPIISDSAGSTALQPGYATTAYAYLTEFYITGVAAPTYRDTDGHMTNWVVDGLGRPSQTQECTASTNQGQQCSGTWLVTNETWDANNALTALTDGRGYETDYAYDANGNTIAIGEPQTTTSQGRFRPTKLYDYDAFNNVTAYCNESETHPGGDWTTLPSPSDTLCSSHAVPHVQFTYTYPSYEPYGELVTITTPMGYNRRISYSLSQQGGVDYGLPTSVAGDSFTQVDGSSVTPTQSFWYDGMGYLRCYGKGQGTSVLSYDLLGRMTNVADPDDTTANSGSVCSKATGQPGWNTQTTFTYFPDGTKQSSQSPAERAGNVSTAYSYDLDGNKATETEHYGCALSNSWACTPGVTQNWYDGADRLVEVSKPQDLSDLYTYAWLTRYLYDLTQSGSVSISTASFQAHGDLFKTQEWLTGPGATSPSWTDLRGNAFDALDRPIAKYTFSPTASTTLSTATMQYDGSSALLGFLGSETDPLGEVTSFTYDELGQTTAVAFTGDAGVTPAKTFLYDANGRAVVASGATYGSQTTNFDADGRISEVDESTNGSVTSPARLMYDYYPNGDRKDLNVSSSGLTAAPLVTYARRNDGMLLKESMRYGGITNSFSWTFTDGGRKLSQIDPYTGTTMPSPQAPVNPGTVYASTNWSYDSTGQLTGLNLPETLNYSVGHDDEGHLAYSGANVTGSSTFVAGTSFWNTTRGENFQQPVTPPPPGMVFASRPANGALVPGAKPRGMAPSSSSAAVFDPINAVVVGSNLSATSVDSDGFPVPCGVVPSIDTYDAASRLISRPNNSLAPGPNGECNQDGFPQTWSYDAENHTIGQLSGTAQWGPAGKPYRILSGGSDDSLHYDGGALLFVTNAQGNLTDLKLGALADVTSGGQMTVWDRDTSNMLTTGHNNSLYYGVSFGGRKFGPFRGGEGPGTVPAGVQPVTFQGSTTAAPCTMQSCGIPLAYRYSRLEGFDWGNLTIQGARTVDNMTGQWTTPDAYAGNVRDPMSQKPFMWDRNNPYEYSDPTGFAPIQQPQGNGEGIVVAGAIGGAGNSAGDPLPNDPSGLDPNIWSPAQNPNPGRSRGSGGDWYYNSRDKTWVRYDRGVPGGRQDHWHFYTTNPRGPRTPGGLPAPQDPVKVGGDRHLDPGDRPGGFSNHSSILDFVRNVLSRPYPLSPFPIPAPGPVPVPVPVPL